MANTPTPKQMADAFDGIIKEQAPNGVLGADDAAVVTGASRFWHGTNQITPYTVGVMFDSIVSDNPIANRNGLRLLASLAYGHTEPKMGVVVSAGPNSDLLKNFFKVNDSEDENKRRLLVNMFKYFVDNNGGEGELENILGSEDKKMQSKLKGLRTNLIKTLHSSWNPDDTEYSYEGTLNLSASTQKLAKHFQGHAETTMDTIRRIHSWTTDTFGELFVGIWPGDPYFHGKSNIPLSIQFTDDMESSIRSFHSLLSSPAMPTRSPKEIDKLAGQLTMEKLVENYDFVRWNNVLYARKISGDGDLSMVPREYRWTEDSEKWAKDDLKKLGISEDEIETIQPVPSIMSDGWNFQLDDGSYLLNPKTEAMVIWRPSEGDQAAITKEYAKTLSRKVEEFIWLRKIQKEAYGRALVPVGIHTQVPGSGMERGV
jgi:hypothetical protein